MENFYKLSSVVTSERINILKLVHIHWSDSDLPLLCTSANNVYFIWTILYIAHDQVFLCHSSLHKFLSVRAASQRIKSFKTKTYFSAPRQLNSQKKLLLSLIM